MVMNDDRTILYAIDGGNKRVLEIDVNSANRLRSLGLINEQLADHSEWNADFEVLASDENFNYCGMAINGNRLFVGDFDNGNVRCIDLNTKEELGRIETGVEGMTGLAVYDNQLYFVSYATNSLYKIEAK
jgi:sugar lactone lactonase YvrE